jgi:hypothetical protein
MLSYDTYKNIKYLESVDESTDAVQQVQAIFSQFRQEIDAHLKGVGLGNRLKGGVLNATRSLAAGGTKPDGTSRHGDLGSSIAGAMPSKNDLADPQKLRDTGLASSLGKAGVAGVKSLGRSLRRGIFGEEVEFIEGKAEGLDAIDSLQSQVLQLVKQLADENEKLKQQIPSGGGVDYQNGTYTPKMPTTPAFTMNAEPTPQAVYSVMSALPPSKVHHPMVAQVIEKLQDKKNLTTIAKEMGMTLPALKKQLSAIHPDLAKVLDEYKGKKPSSDFSAFDKYQQPSSYTV